MTAQENQLAKLCFSMCHHFSTRTGINALETASTVSWSPLELLDFQVSQNLFYLQEIFPNLSKQLHSNYDCVHDRPVPPSPKQGTKICAFFGGVQIAMLTQSYILIQEIFSQIPNNVGTNII